MLAKEIRTNWDFNVIDCGNEILSLGKENIAWTIKQKDGSYGVFLPYDGPEINEEFSSAQIYDAKVNINSEQKKMLFLLTTDKQIYVPFSALCAEFVDPGENGVLRKALISDPSNWWRQWKKLLGNKDLEDQTYAVLGELCALNYLIDKGEYPVWNGPNGASYDLETVNRLVEVKSTIVRDRREITVHSPTQFQPPKDKPLDLFFCVFELSTQTGLSINSIVSKLNSKGYDITSLEKSLEHLGLPKGKSARTKTYILHYMLKYNIDDSFPKITDSMFVDGRRPEHISKYSYVVDLTGLNGETLISEDNDEV